MRPQEGSLTPKSGSHFLDERDFGVISVRAITVPNQNGNGAFLPDYFKLAKQDPY